jgi:hypothetical protein
MENAVKTRLQSVQLGEVQTHKNIAIVPLIAQADGIFQYRTLRGSPQRGVKDVDSNRLGAHHAVEACWL